MKQGGSCNDDDWAHAREQTSRPCDRLLSEWVRFTLKSRCLRVVVEIFTGNRAQIKLRDYSLH
jgi:hypothetical protein